MERLTNFGEDVEIGFNYACFIDVVAAIFIERHTSSSFKNAGPPLNHSAKLEVKGKKGFKANTFFLISYIVVIVH